MNPFRGESPLVVDGRAYTLVLDFNAICVAEGELALDMDQIVLNLDQRLSFTLLRALVWAGTRKHHPEITLEQAGNLCSDAGLAVVREAVGQAMLRTLGKEKEGGKNPPKRGRAGTGSKP